MKHLLLIFLLLPLLSFAGDVIEVDGDNDTIYYTGDSPNGVLELDGDVVYLPSDDSITITGNYNPDSILIVTHSALNALFQWYAASDTTGTSEVALVGETNDSLTIADTLMNYWISCKGSANGLSDQTERDIVLCEKTDTVLSRLTYWPTGDYIEGLNSFIDTIYKSGAWDSLEYLYAFWFDNETDSKKNLLSTDYTLTEVATVDFIPGYGIQRHTGTNGYLNTGFTPSTSSKWLLNDACIGLYITTGESAGDYYPTGVNVSGHYTGILGRQSGGLIRMYMNGFSTGWNDGNPNDTGFLALSLLNGNAVGFLSGVEKTQASCTPVNVCNYPIAICAAKTATSASGYSYKIIGGAFGGGHVTTAQMRVIKFAYERFYNVVKDQYLTLTSPSKNLIYRDGDNLYITSKYDATHDLQVKFGRTYLNTIVTFINTYLNANTGTNISSNIFRTENTINSAYLADNIGPINVYGQSWTGGAHGWDYNQSYWELTSNYTAGGTTMALESTEDFVTTGGYARSSNATVFSYTGKSGNNLTGVSCSISISSGDSVKIFPSTSNTTEVSYTINGTEIPNYKLMSADSLKATIRNTSFKMLTLSRTTGLCDTLYYEDVVYTINKGTIKVNTTITPLENFDVATYYGLQIASNVFNDTLYFASDSIPNIWAMPNTLAKSGDHDDYPCYRAIQSNSDKSINLSVNVEDVGLSTDRLLLDTMSMFYEPNAKVYNNFIYKSTVPFYDMDLGETYYWQGYYNFFGGQNTTRDSLEYAYPQYQPDGEHWFIDAQRSYIDTIDFGKTVTSYDLIEKTDSITIGILNNNKLPITSTGFGWAEIKIE
jgi:hypothetical protein